MTMSRRSFLGFTGTFAGTLAASGYAAGLDRTEIVHFWIAVPAGHVDRPKVLASAGRPLRLAPVTIDLDKRGALKRWLQPDLEGLSTHWIVNTGKKPVRVRMELVNATLPIHWKVNANFPYDPQTRTFLQPLMPGASIPNLAIDWMFEIPRDGGSELPCGGRMAYSGGLKLSDADSGELLTFIPITIGRGVCALHGRRSNDDEVVPETCEAHPGR